MANGEGADNNGTSEGRNWFDLLIVALALLALVIALLIVVGRYQTSKDAAAILGVIAPAITTIAGAVFGIAVGQRPAKTKAREAKELKSQVDRLGDTLRSVFGKIETLPSPAGERVFALRERAEAPGLEFDQAQLAEAREQLARVEQGLNSIAR